MNSTIDKGSWIKGVAEWTEGDTAFVSVAFTWRVLEARAIALDYKARGFKVRVGGPGVFLPRLRKLVSDVAEVGGRIPDVLVRHNPMATRASYGCPVGCWFCTVPKMDGKTFTLVPDFPVRPVLCDDNLSALPADYQEHIVRRYLEAGVPLLDANSGFEPATFTREVFERWAPVLKGPWRFGYDEKTEGGEVKRVFDMLHAEGVKPRRIQVYTMIGHEPFDVCMERIRSVIAWGGEPYAQPFLKLNALEKKPAIRHDWTRSKLRAVTRWVNRHLWRKTRNFADYNASAKTTKVRAADPNQMGMFS